MTLKVPVIDTADYRLPPEVEARLGGRDTGWRYPPFLNGWVNFGNGCEPLRYRKDADGRVQLSGFLGKPGTANPDQLPIIQLPVGFRPDFNYRIAAVNTDSFSEMQLGADGVLMVLAPSVGTWLSFQTSFWAV